MVTDIPKKILEITQFSIKSSERIFTVEFDTFLLALFREQFYVSFRFFCIMLKFRNSSKHLLTQILVKDLMAKLSLLIIIFDKLNQIRVKHSIELVGNIKLTLFQRAPSLETDSLLKGMALK